MDNTKRHCGQNRDAPIYTETISCSSSSTLVESINSTPNLSLESDGCCPSLDQLPTHLRSAITAYLDVVSRICLQGVNHHFRKVIDVDRAKLSTCARYVLASHFRKSSNSNSGLLATCALCKTSLTKKRYSADHVRYLDEPQHETSKWTVRVLDRIPWVRRYTTLDLNKRYLYRLSKRGRSSCYAHLLEKFVTNPQVEALLPFVKIPEDKPAWLAFTVLRCMHCGKCISEGDKRLEGCIDCMCDFCFRAPGYQFRRCGPGRSDQIRPRQIFMDPISGGTRVVEGTGKSRISVPVLFPICRADGTRLLDSHICYVNEARAVRLKSLRGATQQNINSQLDSQARLEREILRLLGE